MTPTTSNNQATSAVRVASPYARELERQNRRQEALGAHAPRALALAEQGLALADAWAAFEREALATDPRLARKDQSLDRTFNVAPWQLRDLCLVMHERATRLLPPLAVADQQPPSLEEASAPSDPPLEKAVDEAEGSAEAEPTTNQATDLEEGA
jgi:hypothetical protein